MPNDENVFAKAADALSRVQEVAASSREVIDSIKALRVSVEAAAHNFQKCGTEAGNRIELAVGEIQKVRSDLLSARSELNVAVDRLRESEGRVLAEIAKQAESIKEQSKGHLRSVCQLVWATLGVSFIGVSIGVALLLIHAGVFTSK